MDALLGSARFTFLLLTIGALALSQALAEGDGYMTLVGPKPLRFAVPIQRQDPTKVLPALIMTEAAQTNTVPLEEFGAAAQQPLDPGIDQDLVQAAAPPLQPEPAPAPVVPKAATAETLLQFFTPTHRKGAIITTPVDFAPPPASSGKSSTATYTSQ